tara:strand:- start:21 stop:350 length:330 start_codon:yes stop_codon:yes gene_type:complete
METWMIVGLISFVLGWVWIAYEIYRAPLMPEDFDLREEDIWPGEERPCNEGWEKDPDVLEFLEREDNSEVWTNEEDNKIHTVGGLSNDKEGSFMEFQKKQKDFSKKVKK